MYVRNWLYKNTFYFLFFLNRRIWVCLFTIMEPQTKKEKKDKKKLKVQLGPNERPCRYVKSSRCYAGDPVYNIPIKKTEGAGCFDLHASRENYILYDKNNKKTIEYSTENYVLPPYCRMLVCTTVAVKIPKGYCGRICSRSGTSLRSGIEVGAGVIDSDYRGVVNVLLYNHTAQHFVFKQGDRIAQLMIIKIADIDECEIVDSLDETNRGDKGFGSSGIK